MPQPQAAGAQTGKTPPHGIAIDVTDIPRPVWLPVNRPGRAISGRRDVWLVQGEQGQPRARYAYFVGMIDHGGQHAMSEREYVIVLQ
jgi:hypothetical protein